MHCFPQPLRHGWQPSLLIHVLFVHSLITWITSRDTFGFSPLPSFPQECKHAFFSCCLCSCLPFNPLLVSHFDLNVKTKLKPNYIVSYLHIVFSNFSMSTLLTVSYFLVVTLTQLCTGTSASYICSYPDLLVTLASVPEALTVETVCQVKST